MRTFAAVDRRQRRVAATTGPPRCRILGANAEFEPRLKKVSDYLVTVTERVGCVNGVAEPSGSSVEHDPVRLARAVFAP